MPIVNVASDNYLHTFAISDTDSSNTFISERAFNLLGLNGDCITYNLSALSNSNTVNSKIVNFTLYSVSGDKSLHMSGVCVVDNIPYTHHKLDVNQYDHLKNIPFANIKSSHADMLIGQDNAEAILPLDVSKGRKGEPFATLTMFGWSANGTTVYKISNNVINNLFLLCR